MNQTAMLGPNGQGDFEGKSYFASSLNDHDGGYILEDDEMLMMNQSLGTWYAPENGNPGEAGEPRSKGGSSLKKSKNK